MSSWYWSWIPGLPSIDFALPSTIQRRFLSFVLKKSLGHLLKPGQLDINQIDSQIGSGYVQIKDLELDNDAINSHLAGLPLKLHDGSIASVTARIPWPNPLTSTLGFSLESLHLTFYLDPNTSDVPFPSVNLADSVASVADSFIHDELDPREEATLRESFHADLAASTSSVDDDQHVPGGLNPFISAPEDEDFHGEADPSGVSMFATLIERLLARFEFAAVDTKISIVLPENACFTFSVQDVTYGTEASRDTDPQGATPTTDTPDRGVLEDPRTPEGQSRTLTISGVSVSARTLVPPKHTSPAPLTPSTASPVSPAPSASIYSNAPPSPTRSASPSSSSSSLDEDTQLMMSQSLASLPPRPPSPSSSVASSMYQSAISTVHEVEESPFASNDLDDGGSVPESRSVTPSPGDRRADDVESTVSSETCHHSAPPSPAPTSIPDESQLPRDETILSFGSEPIVIRMTTPPPSRRPQPSTEPSSSSLPSQASRVQESERLKVSLSAGVLACAFQAWQVRALLDVARAWGSHRSPVVPTTPASSSPGTSAAFLGLAVEASATIRGVVVLVLPVSCTSSASVASMADFWNRPLVPPRLPHGYLRVHVEGVSASALLSTPTPTALSTAQKRPRENPRETGPTIVTLTLACHELSAFAFRAPPSQSTQDQELSASPLLITDHHLPSQYSSIHTHPDPSRGDPQLPSFAVMDWTDPTHRGSSRVSTWRSKLKPKPSKHSRRDSQTPMGASPSSPSKSPFAGSEGLKGPETLPRAIVATGKIILPSKPAAHGKRRDKGVSEDSSVEVNIVPLHIFIDVGLVLCDETLRFLDEAVGSSLDVAPPMASDESPDADPDSEGDDTEGADTDDDEGTPPATPGPRTAREREREKERERRRLEKLVLQDLDLDLDYRDPQPKPKGGMKRKSKRTHGTDHSQAIYIAVMFSMIRTEIRCPSPPKYAQRSGSIVLDLHQIKLDIPSEPPNRAPPTARFASSGSSGHEEDIGRDSILSAQCQRLVVAVSLKDDTTASAVLSLGPLLPEDQSTDAMNNTPTFGAHALPTVTRPRPPLPPRITLTQSNSTQSSPDPHKPHTLVVAFDIPSLHASVSKPLFDGIQLFVDDAAQFVERTLGSGMEDTGTEKGESRDSSIIGSRFFAKTSRRNGSSESESGSGFTVRREDTSTQRPSETVIKLVISEAFVRLFVPREHDEFVGFRPFDISSSDIDVLMEMKPEGKNETVFTVGVMDLNIDDTSSSNSRISMMSLTSPRSLSSAPKTLLKVRFTSLVLPGTTAKESRVKVTLWGFTYTLYPDLKWTTDLGRFFKAPPGTFESVIPSECTRVNVKIMDGSIRALAPTHPGSLVFHVGDLEFSTDLVGDSPETSFHLLLPPSPPSSVLFIDDSRPVTGTNDAGTKALVPTSGVAYWKGSGYALLAEVADLDLGFNSSTADKLPDVRVLVDRLDLRAHLCADTGAPLGAFIGDLTSAFKPPPDPQAQPKPRPAPSMVSEQRPSRRGIMSTVDEHAFRRAPDVGPAPDMISDDLPSNLDYLDDSFSAAAGLRELRDDDLDEFDLDTEKGTVTPTPGGQQMGVISSVGGETITMLRPLNYVENHFDTIPPEAVGGASKSRDTTLSVRVHNCDVTLFLYDGYDWARTRKMIEDEVKDMRRRLAKIRQLVANGQTQDPSLDEETSAVLFNSVYIGLEQDVNELEPGALIAAIDEELNDEGDSVSQSSWQSLRPPSGKGRTKSTRVHGKRLTRSKGPSIEFRLSGVDAEVDQYRPGDEVSRTFATVRDLEILDHIKTSTWKKFLTDLRADSRGNVRETDSNMVRVEIRTVHPVADHPSEEARLRAKILPLRLYVDQDALDFLKKFFSFQDPNAPSAPPSDTPSEGIYFQHAEIFPIGLKLDYKPRRVDYRALREGKTIELMNFFHFDGAEMTLRHITLSGITGWPRLFDLLNDLWTPDVKATQLVEVISGVAPIRSVVNVGSGVADLVLLPIAQYKKDGRIVRGVQKGTTAFVKSTAMEAIKLGARLATGTQVILEQAEHVLGGRFDDSITAEAVQISPLDIMEQERGSSDEDEAAELISRYAEQPDNVAEGVQSAYKSLQRNFNSAAQTILAVPMEVYERSGNEGPVRSVIRAVPIAVLKPMIGASEAVSKTLMGLHNTMDPNVRLENEEKYKHR